MLLLGCRDRSGRVALKPGETVTSGIGHQFLSMSDGGKRAGGAGEHSGPSRYFPVSGGSIVERRPTRRQVDADSGRFGLEEQVASGVSTEDERRGD